MGKGKTNPRRIPRSQADVDAAREDGVLMGLTLFLWVMAERGKAPVDELRCIWDMMQDTLDSIARKYITWKDLETTLREEYEIEVREK